MANNIQKIKLPEEVRLRVTERYLKEYCADEQEAREIMELLKTGPTWFEWWLEVLASELKKARTKNK